MRARDPIGLIFNLWGPPVADSDGVRIVDRIRRSMTNPRERESRPTPWLLAGPRRDRGERGQRKRSGATIAPRRADIVLQAGASGENERRILSRSRQNGRPNARGRKKKRKKIGTRSSLFHSPSTRRADEARNETLGAPIHAHARRTSPWGYVDVTRVEIPPRRRRRRDARRSKAPPGDSLCLIHVISTPTIHDSSDVPGDPVWLSRERVPIENIQNSIKVNIGISRRVKIQLYIFW